MIDRMLRAFGYEKRSEDFSPFAPDVWGRALRPEMYAGAHAVLSNLAVATRCVSLRSELLASVPLKMYRRTASGDKERVVGNPLADVLGDLANPLMTSFGAREFFVRSLDTAGNAYARVERNGAGQVTGLFPLEPTRVVVERLESGRVRYRYSGNTGAVVLLQEEVLHIRASSEDGLLGRSPIAIARGALGVGLRLSKAARESASKQIGGYLQSPAIANNPVKKRLAEAIEEQNKEAGRFGVRILDPGSKFVPNTFSSSDAELLESRRLSNEDVARVFNCPAASVGISNSVSYGSAQQAAADLVQNCLSPLASRIEQDMQRCLLSTDERKTLIIEHDLSGLLRGDATTRWASYKTGREIGALSSEEIRRFENLGPKAQGEDYAPLRVSPTPNEPIASTKP